MRTFLEIIITVLVMVSLLMMFRVVYTRRRGAGKVGGMDMEKTN
jgi:hypothetical protein